MFRSGRMRPTHARSSGSETSLRIRSLAGYIIGTLESRFRKRQGLWGSFSTTHIPRREACPFKRPESIHRTPIPSGR
jgi:hypothetical protein